MNPVFGNIMDMACPPKSIPSAASLILQRNQNKISLTGTTAVTSLLMAGAPSDNEGRPLMIWGGASCSVVLTNTNSPTTAGQMYLGGANITLNENECVILEAKSDGTWRLVFQN